MGDIFKLDIYFKNTVYIYTKCLSSEEYQLIKDIR